jgi:hypothetical protein
MALYQANVFNIFSEDITYNGTAIKGIITGGETNAAGNGYESDGTSDRIVVDISCTDVPAPAPADIILVRDKKWRVVREIGNDGVRVKLLCAGRVKYR